MVDEKNKKPYVEWEGRRGTRFVAPLGATSAAAIQREREGRGEREKEKKEMSF